MLPFSRMKHVGFLVEDIEKAEAIFTHVLGTRSSGINTISLEGGAGVVRTAFFHLEKGSVELVYHRFPESWKNSPLDRGPGFHHLAFEVDDFDKALSDLGRQGISPLPHFPFRTPHGRVAFFPPEQTGGILMELCEKEPVTETEGEK